MQLHVPESGVDDIYMTVPALFFTGRFDPDDVLKCEEIHYEDDQCISSFDAIEMNVTDPYAYIDNQHGGIKLPLGRIVLALASTTFQINRIKHVGGITVNHYLFKQQPLMFDYVQKVGDRFYITNAGICREYFLRRGFTKRIDGCYHVRTVLSENKQGFLRSEKVSAVQRDPEMAKYCVDWDRDWVRASYPPCISVVIHKDKIEPFNEWLRTKYSIYDYTHFTTCIEEIPTPAEQIREEKIKSLVRQRDEIQAAVNSGMYAWLQDQF
jgi:hypothetical protein